MAEIIVALDVNTGAEAIRLLDRLPEARWVKVGSRIMTREGGGLIQRLTDRGLAVFLDLKWHDIPHTVVGAVEAAHELGVAMASVHALGGGEVLAAAAAAAGGTALVGITVLTCHDQASFGAVIGRRDVVMRDEVARLASLAVSSGLSGVVCSPMEVGHVRTEIGRAPWIVVPGIRRAGDRREDQRRVATPRQAVSDGATHLVVGRPIVSARDPRKVFLQIRDEVEACIRA